MMAELTTMDLKDLSSLSQHLNSATDELNTALKDIETRLNKLSLGVEAWVTKKPLREECHEGGTNVHGEPTRGRTTTELGYTRLSDGWALGVRNVWYGQLLEQTGTGEWEWSDTGEQSVYDAKPLLRATRSLRAAAVDRIPDLIDALYEAGTKMADAVEKVRKISDSLK
jgi:hypothetical protein